MTRFNHRIEPLYDTDIIFLSDHVNIQCCVRFAKKQYKCLNDTPKLNCIPMDVSTTHNQSNRKCPYCEKVWPTYANSQLIEHIRTHTGEKPLVCAKGCGYRTAFQSNLPRHEKVCNCPLVLLKCPIPGCLAVSPIERQMDNHVRQCTKRRNEMNVTAKFVCMKCSYSTKKSSNWLKHTGTKLHNVENPLIWYKCIPCNFCTSSNSVHNEHLRSTLHI